jgi:deazaflavin-dependent oxidoreductase (nitroreductase family)
VPLPRSLAEFNKRYTNRVTRRFAAVLPGFGIVTHRGRKSGRSYSLPVNVFRTDGGWVFALTYGQGDWVKNVLAAGGAELHARGRDHRVTDPRVQRDPSRRAVPLPVRFVLRLIGVDEFLYVREASG